MFVWPSWLLLLVVWLIYLTSSSSHITTNSAKGRYLIVSIDNRRLDDSYASSNYHTISSVLNQFYASYHGYGFIQVVMNVSSLVERVNLIHPEVSQTFRSGSTKDLPSSYNFHLHQFRGATWAKVPAIWDLVVRYKNDYDYILFVDSDAAFNPAMLNRTIDDALDSWMPHDNFDNHSQYSSETKSTILNGNPNVKNASIVFLSNFPWRVDLPCTGVMLINLKSIEPFLLEWWDFNLPSKNFVHFHEQDALWHMIESQQEFGFLIDSKFFSIVTENQFPSDWQPYRKLWICHIAGYNYIVRKPIFHNFLSDIKRHEETAYIADLKHIIESHLLVIDLFDVCLRMEKRAAELLTVRRKDFPKHDTNTQNLWYNANVTSAKMPKLSPSVLYNGDLVAAWRGRQIYLVENGIRRAVPNWDTFQAMNYSSNSVIRLSNEDLNAIAEGNPLMALDYP